MPQYKYREQTGKGGVLVLLLVLAGIFVALFIFGLLPRLSNKKELDAAHKITSGAVPVVQVETAKKAPFKEQGDLPGTFVAWFEFSRHSSCGQANNPPTDQPASQPDNQPTNKTKQTS